jgi:hypothetical protein
MSFLKLGLRLIDGLELVMGDGDVMDLLAFTFRNQRFFDHGLWNTRDLE